ncbi:hypothetical protein KM043_010043 [Ampulex compressa]|nr:hypothetical protein KM043_010043 [Ampulex compressa]
MESFVSCVFLVAKRLFDPRNRISIIVNEHNPLEDKITRVFMNEEPITIDDLPALVPNHRQPSFLLFDDDLLSRSRGSLLQEPLLREQEYLFVTKAEEAVVSGLAVDLWAAGFRDLAFLMLNDAYDGRLVRPNATEDEIVLSTIGVCASLEKNRTGIQPFSADIFRFGIGNRSLVFGNVADITVKFWRGEDKLRLRGNAQFETIGGMLMDRFRETHNLSVITRIGKDLSWPEATAKLINGEIDVVSGVPPEDGNILEALEVVCWYRYRYMVFAARVRYRNFGNEILKLLMPFRLSVWLCFLLLLVVYALLVFVLRRLSASGLIRERVAYMEIYAISLAQSVSFPKKFGLRLVLLIWMIFSLHLNIAYNSTFTSILSRVDEEDLLTGLEDLRDSGQPIGGPLIAQTFLKQSQEPYMKDLYDRYIIMEAADTFKAIFENRTMGVVQQFTVNKLNWEYRMNRSLRIYTLAEPILKFPVLLFTRRGHPFRLPLRQIVTDFRETALTDKWMSTYVIDENKEMAMQQTDGILTLKHLRVVIQLFFICELIGVLICLVEILLSRFWNIPR